MATTRTPSEPTTGSLAWFMLCYTVKLPNTLPSSNSLTDTGHLLPTSIEDLGSEFNWLNVQNFAFRYDHITFNPANLYGDGMPASIRDGRYAGEYTLSKFLDVYLWRSANAAMAATQELPYEYDGAISPNREDVTIQLRVDDCTYIKCGIVEIKTRFSLSEEEMNLLRDQQPSTASKKSRKILKQLLKYFVEAECSWGAITNGYFTLFMRYNPTDRSLKMSEVIDHTKPGLIAYYCYLARLAANDRPAHRPRRIRTHVDQIDVGSDPEDKDKDKTKSKRRRSSRASTSRSRTSVPMTEVLLDMPAFSEGNFAKVYSGTTSKQGQSVMVKMSYGGTESNGAILTEIHRYYILHDLWGSVLPELYGAGPVQEDEQYTDTYCLVLEKLDKIDWTNPKIKYLAKAALKRIHEYGIAHQDVKRDNLRWRSKTGEVVVIDLGSATEGTSEDMADDIGSVDEL